MWRRCQAQMTLTSLTLIPREQKYNVVIITSLNKNFNIIYLTSL